MGILVPKYSVKFSERQSNSKRSDKDVESDLNTNPNTTGFCKLSSECSRAEIKLLVTKSCETLSVAEHRG